MRIQPKFRHYLNLLILSFCIIGTFSACAQSTVKTKKINVMSQSDSSTIQKSEEEWKKVLSEEEYYILREKGTERPYTGKFLMHKENGTYTCRACGNELFSSDSKFDSHCGWPSFDKEIAAGKIKTQEDNSLGMRRVEIMCARCGGHLGHVFDDGPTATGLRYCVNSVSLGFEPASSASTMDTLTLGGGCFWCIEAIYQMVDGVKSVQSGYSGGSNNNPTYEQVCTGATGHAEVVQIVYDTTKARMEDVLKVFFTVHDPTTLNRQGADVGIQYRSVIFYRNERQKQIAERVIAELNAAKVYDNPIVTQVTPFAKFWKAEDYHQNYFRQNSNKPYCQMVIQPKIDKFEKVFAKKK